MNEYKNIKIKKQTPVGDWKNIREEFPTDEESQYLVRLDKGDYRRYFVCQLVEGAWNSKSRSLRGCSFDHFDFIFDEPDADQQAQAELIPDPEIPDCFWMRLE
jgi:hypothetical protein